MSNRAGIPFVRQGTAAAVAAKADNNAVDLAFKRYAAGKTTHVRIDNKSGAVPLRVFFTQPPLDLAGEFFFDLPANGIFDQPIEVTDIWLAGVGGTAAFQYALSERVG